MRAVDWSLYLVTDSRLVGERPLGDVVRAAIRGGAGVVQYREKAACTRAMVKAAGLLGHICARMGALFLINDRIDVALAVGADGVHLGQDDMPVPVARSLLGQEKIVGVTVHNAAELERAQMEGADYVSIAPAFATSTKPDHQKPLGLEGVAALAREASVPAVVIGGIDRSNAEAVARTGVQGICVVSAIVAAPDPEQSARELLELFKKGALRG